MSFKKIVIIFLILLFLVGGFLGGMYLAYRHGKSSSFDKQIPLQIQIAQSNLLYRDKKAKGEWDEKTLIIENLKILTGEKKAEEVYRLPKVKRPSITPIKRRADKFLQESQDEAAKQEIRRLLKKLFPDFSKATALAPHKSSFGFIQNAYADGRRCFESYCFNSQSFAGGGFTNELYIEESVGGNADFTRTVTEALNDALTTYQGLGLRGRRAVVVVMPVYYEGDWQVEASAAMESFLGEQLCLTHIWGNGVNAYNATGAAYFKQVLAHEVFHCFQGENFPRQMNGPPIEVTDWWVEGSADYFSNVVYPSTNAEYIYDADFDGNSATTPLYRMSYEANVFFQEMANLSSNASIFALITALPSSGSFADQQSALASISSFNDLFHHFAQDYLDGKIRDTSGAMRSLSPQWGSVENIREARNLTYSVEPFIIGRKKLHFESSTNLFHLNVREEAPGKYSSRKGNEEAWQALPPEVGAMSCDSSEDEDFKLAYTKVAASNEAYQLHIDITQSAGAGTPPPGVDPHATSDSCLRGNWQIDPASDQAALASAFAQLSGRVGHNVQLQSFNINASGCFKNNNLFAAQMTYDVQSIIQFPRFPMTMHLEMNTQGFGNYLGQSGTLSLWNTGYTSFSGRMTASGGGRTNTTTLPFPTSTNSVQLAYRCYADHMEIQIPMDPQPWVRLNKVRAR